MTPPEFDLTGQTLSNQYFLREAVGSSGMGDVYRAWDQKRSALMAVKILKPTDLQHKYSVHGTYAAEKFVRMFAAEAGIMRRLEHPNIVRLYDLNLDRQWGVAFFVMEWVDGKDFAQILEEEKSPLSLQETEDILHEVALALNFAHAENRIHCDIKPGNIMKDKNYRIIVTDFGLARMITEKGLGGTPAYMAPEQYTGHAVTPQTDIYALGVTLFQLLTNQLPFTGTRPASQGQGNSLERIWWEHLNMQPPSLRQYNPTIPEPVEQVVHKAMEKRQRSRFRTTIDLYTAFNDAIQGEDKVIGMPHNLIRLNVDPLLDMINRARREGWTELDLSGKELTSMPPEIGHLQNLQVLKLHNNRITGLPPEIGQLQNLQHLDLGNNWLTSLPPEIEQLKDLRELYLGFNGLMDLLPEIGQLHNLQSLVLRSNVLTSLPQGIGQLQNLQHLDLLNNRITGLLPEIGQLQNLRHLDLWNNQLTSLPPEIGQLQHLQSLSLASNRLVGLPPEIQNLTQLEKLDLRANPDLAIPEEIIGMDWDTLGNPQTILEYYFSNFRRLINEVKVILVGEADVGKTALVRRLKQNRYRETRESTRGVNIVKWNLPVGDHDVRLNLWDFGGQEIMHSTHQFFLTRRTLYLLVLDATQNELQNNVRYWLNMIQNIAGEDAPVIVVQNKIDQWKGGMNTNMRPFEREFAQIKGVYETSCSEDIGIEQLKVAMAEVIGTIDGVHDEWPVEWLNVKAALEAQRGERDIIDYLGYLNICAQNGVEEAEVQDGLLRFLHELGVVLSFVDDWRLVDQHVLNPEWVTEGVYKITTAKKVVSSKGVLNAAQDLAAILKPPRYQRPHYHFMLDMLEKFRLAFRYPTHPQHYLIPALLDDNEPPDLPDTDGALSFAYAYPDILPPHIMSVLIVFTRGLSINYWRNGVVLENDGNSALVTANKHKGWVQVCVMGPPHTRKNLLLKVRAYLDLIHATMPGLKPEAQVLVRDVAVPYSYLLKLLHEGEEKFRMPGIEGERNIYQYIEGVAWEREKETLQVQNVYHLHGGDLVMKDKFTGQEIRVGNIDDADRIAIGSENTVS